ncbi:MAG: argininosuccinate synthase [Candidatus Kaistia colombiensis]|nr:MAG: argininosuccinate synthase [Kaistia sp.]
MFRANTLYEGAYLLGTSIARPLIAKRLDRDRQGSRRRRDRPWRHRQGQRPGPFRALGLCAEARTSR